MKISGSRASIFGVMMALCVAPVIYAMVFRQEIFPWSSFPMYSGLNSGKHLMLVSAYVLDENGQEIPIERTGIVRPKYEYRWRLKAESLKDRAIEESEIAILKRFAEIFKDDLSQKNFNFKDIRFYFEYWNSFTGPTRHLPDERRVLYEQALQ